MTKTALSPETVLARDTTDFHHALTELVRVYQFRDRKRVCYYDLSVTQCYALEAIVRLGLPRVDDVASELQLEKSTASRVVDSLVKRDYAVREPDPDDGRAVRIRATPKGRRLHRRIEEDLLAQTRELLSPVDSRTRRATARLIAEFARAARRRFFAETPSEPSADERVRRA